MAIFLTWFFVKAPGNILNTGRDFLVWGWRFFSIGYFLPRLFAPWHRDITGYGRGFDLQRWIKVWSWNLISRLIGAVMRLIVMGIGLMAEIFLILATIFVFVFWLVIPFLIPAFFVIGIVTMFI